MNACFDLLKVEARAFLTAFSFLKFFTTLLLELFPLSGLNSLRKPNKLGWMLLPKVIGSDHKAYLD